MYSNGNKKGFSILDLIVKIIFAGLFIFVLVWLFQKKVPNMKPFYSNVFRENIKYMQEAGENYFTDDKMPKEVGENTKLTLAELENRKLVLPFVDEDGNACNKNDSYVSITKLEEGYELKTNLVCSKESDYTVKVLGCHNYCPTGNCPIIPEQEKEEPEKTCTVAKIKQYQFKKLSTSTKTSYTCDSGYTLKGQTCVKTVKTDSVSAEKTTTKERTEKIAATATIKNGTKTRLNPVVTTNKSYTAVTKKTLTTTKNTSTGTANYVKTQLKTTVTTTPSSTRQEAYSCPKQTTTRQCSTSYQTYSYTCNCTSGVDSTGKSRTSCSTCTGSTPVESCHNVTSTVNSTCYKTVTVPGSTSYSCPSGTTIKEGSGSSLKCYKTSCPSGYTQSGSGTSTKCTKTTTTYSCPTGTNVKEGSGSSLKCYNYSCPSGYTAEGSGASMKCYKNTRTYSCPSNTNAQEGTGANIKCYNVTNGSVSYSCPSGYKLSGKECTRTVKDTSTTLSCPSGYKLEGKVCNKYTTQEKSANVKKDTSSKYTYKWSSSKSLKGWTKTGKTRTVNGKKTCK